MTKKIIRNAQLNNHSHTHVNRVAPYEWYKTQAGNSLTKETSSAFSVSNGIISTESANNRNTHFYGPGTNVLTDYSIRGTLRFSDTDAEFGINFYSQFPDDDEKYSIIRKDNGLMYLYYYASSGDSTLLGTQSGNDTLDQADTWYNYEIVLGEQNGLTRIMLLVWDASDSKPDDYCIDTTDGNLSSGRIGLVTHSGTGGRYWGPVSVVSNVTAEGAYMASEDFISDTIVDVMPYVPFNWHPDYALTRFPDTLEVNGFVLDTSEGDTALIYTHKPGVEYPVTCRLIPETNLSWRNYEFSGTIEKPEDSLYDYLSIRAIIYQVDEDEYYSLDVDGFDTSGSGGDCYFKLRRHHGASDTLLGTYSANWFAGDTNAISFKVRAITTDKQDGETTINDGSIELSARVWLPSDDEPDVWHIERVDENVTLNKVEGYCGFKLNKYEDAGLLQEQTNGLRIKNVTIQKAQ